MKKKLLSAFVVGTIYFSSFLPLTQASCTLIGATGSATVDKSAYMASTSDNPYIEGPRKPVLVTIPDNGYKYVSTPCFVKEKDGSFTNVGADRGMNETGFSWTRSWVVPNEVEDINKTDAVKWFEKLASTVSSVDEAINFVETTPKGIGCQGNYIFSDAKGNVAIVEVGFKTVTVAQKWNNNDNGYGARANRYETNSMKKIDISDKESAIYYNSSEYRYNEAMKLLKADDGKISPDILKQIVSNRNMNADDSKPHSDSISNHGSISGTVSAEVYDPSHKIFWYTYGWPDGNVENASEKQYGANVNSWGTWIPFDLNKLNEPGFYTDWNGNITPLGVKYLSSLLNK